jgi:hypothetical protein
MLMKHTSAFVVCAYHDLSNTAQPLCAQCVNITTRLSVVTATLLIIVLSHMPLTHILKMSVSGHTLYE